MVHLYISRIYNNTAYSDQVALPSIVNGHDIVIPECEQTISIFALITSSGPIKVNLVEMLIGLSLLDITDAL